MTAARRAIGLAVCLGGLVPLAGCDTRTKLQQMGVGPMIPVRGKVTLGGKPLGGGIVYLYPPAGEERAYIPMGFIDPQGNYSVTTSGEKDPGAPAGKYRVTVEPGSGDKSMDLAVDPKYQSWNTTPFLIEVREDAPPGTYDLKMERKH